MNAGVPTPFDDGLTWEEITSSFNVLSARDLAVMEAMERHQDVRDEVDWLTVRDQPLVLLFVSHRWRTLQHPDPDAKDLRAIQRFLDRLVKVLESLSSQRDRRLELVPSLSSEGDLQAEEIARRMLGYGPFADTTAAMLSAPAKRALRDCFKALGGDGVGFRDWLLARIGVWIDYVCMPQRPLEARDESTFRRTLEMLDSLAASSTLVALREPGDDYATRGWCSAEFLLASGSSFSRGLFVDVERLRHGQEVAHESGPVASSRADTFAANVMAEAYELDDKAFRLACDEWLVFEGAFLDVIPPSAWSEYRSMQGSSFYPAAADPNPFRRAFDAVTAFERFLLARWFLSDEESQIDLAEVVARHLGREGVRCAQDPDLVYIGLLLASNARIEYFRPLNREGLRRYLAAMPVAQEDDRVPQLNVVLRPLPSSLRARFAEVQPASVDTWVHRLSTRHSGDQQEREVIAAVHAGLAEHPPEFSFVDPEV